MSNGLHVNLFAARAALAAGCDNVVQLLVRVQAPDSPETGVAERPGLNLAIVIDRSGSMSGQPLHEAKRCAAFMIDGLTSRDNAAIVAYDDSAQVFAASQPVTCAESLKYAVAQIHSGGSTNLHGGWLAGAEQAAARMDRARVNRVLLLSDGNANAGVTALKDICSQCAQRADIGVTTSTYGLGRSFNENLMTAMARSGGGRAYYSETADSLLENFREEFSLLASICARDLRLSLKPLPGVRCEVLNRYETLGEGLWRLPDLVYDGEAWAALRLHVDGTSLPPVGEDLAILEVSLVYTDRDGAKCELPPLWLSLPVVKNQEFNQIPEDNEVLRRYHEAEAARLQEDASRAARDRDWSRVDCLIEQSRRLAKRSPWLGEIVANLERLASSRNNEAFSKEALYAASSLSSKLRHKYESNLIDEGSVPLHLRRKVRQGGAGYYGDADISHYQLEIFDNYPVALIDGKRILLDTGSPVSIGDGTPFRIAGRPFALRGQPGFTTREVSNSMGTEIHALIGTDVLSQFGLALDWRGGIVTFHPGGLPVPRGATEIPTALMMGWPVLRFHTRQGEASGVFDTGGKICYAPGDALNGLTPVDHIRDFHVPIGVYETDVYELELQFGGRSFTARFAVLPDSLATLLAREAGLGWVIGTDLLRHGTVFMDLARRRIAASWRAGECGIA